jgi:hypothetical protein
VLALFIASPQFVRIATSRLLHPLSGEAWPKRVQIQLASEPPTRVPVGQRVDLRMKLVRGDKSSMKSIVYYQYDDGPVEQELMSRAADGSYGSSLDARIDPSLQAGTLKIWMRAGDDRIDLKPITVVPRLAIRSVQALVKPPKYVGDQPATTVDLSAAPAVMAAGSDVGLRVSFNKPLSDIANVQIIPVSEEMQAPKVQWTSDSATGVTGAWNARQSLRFHIPCDRHRQFRQQRTRRVRAHRPPGSNAHRADRKPAPQRGAHAGQRRAAASGRGR